MKELILLKLGEVVLKGLNRNVFEELLVKNAKRRLAPLGRFSFSRAQSTIYVEPMDESADIDAAMDILKKLFGVAMLCRAGGVEKELDKIKAFAADYLREQLLGAKTFKVETKRSDKAFPLKSPEISAEVGGYLLERFGHLQVDVHHPDLVVHVEIREHAAYLHAGAVQGAGGLPVGSGGRATLLISGGIDSPVAGHMMARRGLQLDAVHFFSPPYTSERALDKVVDLLRILSAWTGVIGLTVVPFTEIQQEILEKCPEELFTVIMRRFMMRLATHFARQYDCGALITGESVGQVASQTMQAIACTDAVCEMPVFRPLIGMDKEEIVKRSREIGTYATSILPFEDCCTVFTPRHPKTKPKLEDVLKAESALDIEGLCARAVSGAERRMFHPFGGKQSAPVQ